MRDLVAFLKARLAEDEAAAKAAVPGPWLHMHMGSEGCQVVRRQMSAGERPRLRARLTTSNLADDHANAEHIARHDPARVLREVEAKRKIIDRCARVLDAFGDEHGEWPDVTRRERAHADFVLCELAAVWSDHPDYQQEWA